MMRWMCAFLLLAWSIVGQVSARLELDSGEVLSVEATGGTTDAIAAGDARLEVWRIRDDWYRVVVRCTAPPAWASNTWTLPRALHIRSLSVQTKLEPKYWFFRECRAVSEGWVLLDHSMRRDPHDKPAAKAISSTTQWLEAGTALAWDLSAPGMPYPSPSRPDATERLIAVRQMGPGKAPESLPNLAYERLARFRSLQTANVRSTEVNPPQRDLGWLKLRWQTRFAGDRLPGARGPWAWGSLLGADGHRSWSYDGILSAVEWYIRSGDQWAWELAYIATVHKCHQSLYRGPPGHRSAGRWAYEKGSNPGRPTDYRFPEASHEWDAGALAVAQMSGDPELLECMEHRRAGLLATVIPAERSFGARLRGWYLWNLRYWHGMTGDPIFIARAQQVHDGVWSTTRPGEVWFSNDWAAPASTNADPWQQALLLGEMAKLSKVGLVLHERFDAFARATLDLGSWIVQTNYGPTLAGGYRYDIRTGVRSADWPSTAAFFLPLLSFYGAEYEEKHSAAITACCAMITAGSDFQIPVSLPPAELDMGYSRGGPHGAKTIHQTLVMLEDGDLVRRAADQ